MTTTFKTILFTTLCFFLGACGASLQNQSTLATPATANAGLPLPRTDSVEANNLYASALDCYEQQHRATAETRVADRCNALRTYGPRGDDTSQLAEVISCFSRNDHTSPNCVRYVDTTNQPPTQPRQPVQTQVPQGQPEQRPVQQVAVEPQQPTDRRETAMEPWAMQMAQQSGLRFCANDQVLPGGELNERMIFTDVPYPGALTLIPDGQGRMVNGDGLYTIHVMPGPYAYRIMLNDSSGEQMYFFSGVTDGYGNYRLRRGGTVVHTRNGNCLAPILMPDGGSHYITFRFNVRPGTERIISITAYTVPQGMVAIPVNTCNQRIFPGLQSEPATLRPEGFRPRLAADRRTVLPPTCDSLN